MNNVNYYWIEGRDASTEEWERIESILASRGWASLNRPTSRILVAEANGELLGFHVFQFYPFCGPLWTRPSVRGSGLAEELADKMLEFLAEVRARGWLVIAESPHAEKLCAERGMKRVEFPVYAMVGPGGTET